jgi:hypothetical protein
MAHIDCQGPRRRMCILRVKYPTYSKHTSRPEAAIVQLGIGRSVGGVAAPLKDYYFIEPTIGPQWPAVLCDEKV